jgi:Na+-translocating ferredoxin:NAD+ oxidoreductase RnfA subunit
LYRYNLGIFLPICAFIGVYSAMGKGMAVYSALSREVGAYTNWLYEPYWLSSIGVFYHTSY